MIERATSWADWLQRAGYPFDFTNPDAVPPDDVLVELAKLWQERDRGGSVQDYLDMIRDELGLPLVELAP